MMDGSEWRRVWQQLRESARRLLRRQRHEPALPLSVQNQPVSPSRLLPPQAVPADPAEHARQFASDWADRLEAYANRRMREVGVPENWIGTVDVEHRIDRRCFFPDQSVGGRNIHQRGINLDSGILNPDLIDARTEHELSSTWRTERLRHRADAVIAHEFEEASAASPLQHEEARQNAPDTRLNISEEARRLLRIAAGRQK
jgi:hypothetical protein